MRNAARAWNADHQGWISGGYNAIEGTVKGPGDADLGKVSGHWSDVMEFNDRKSSKKRVLFDPTQAGVAPKNVIPEAEQEEYESRRSVLESLAKTKLTG